MPSDYSALPSGPSGSNPPSPQRSASFRDRFNHGRQRSQMPDPNEMDLAFDGPGDDDDEHDAHEEQGLLGNSSPSSAVAAQRSAPMPGDYDFDRDYFLPPPGSPPPFEDYSASNPAPGNSNGIVPTGPVARPRARHFLGGILPLSFLPKKQSVAPGVGGGQSGVFANLSARPDAHAGSSDDPHYANEDTQKEAPPSYQSALRDAVPPYWDTTVVLPSQSSPFGPLSSSINGDEILIDGMGAGNVFGFIWNLVVAAAFQFVGFLLTYVLHTTHAAKYGSRAGLGISLVQMGFQMHTRATELIETGHFSDDSVDPITGLPVEMSDEKMMDQYRGQVMWPQVWHPQEEWGGHGEVYTIHSIEEAAQLAHKYNHTLSDMFGMPSAADVGRANEYFAFMLMAIGWFLILASVGGWARVKRFEHKLRQAQKESEEAQRAARGSIDELHPNEGEDPTPTRQQPGPTELAYYTSAFTQALNGARELQRGFFGMRGRREVSRGDTVFSADNDNDESELLAAQGYDVDHAVVDPDARRNRSLW